MFIKYPSIENSYRTKDISRWLHRHPYLEHEQYYIQEKIHGANIQLIFSMDPMEIASRNEITNDRFMGAHVALAKMQDFLAWAQDFTLNHARAKTHFYGELFGKGVGKGVDYGVDKAIRFFDMRVGGMLISQTSFNTLMKSEMPNYLIPCLGKVNGLQAALDFAETFETTLNAKEGNLAEGIVIKPANVYTDEFGSVFYLKKKTEKFNEKASAPKEYILDEEVDGWNAIFRAYITENRLESVFSKLGPITDKSQVGRYITAMLEDAKVDFHKDYDGLPEDPARLKKIFNVGSVAAQMIMAHL